MMNQLRIIRAVAALNGTNSTSNAASGTATATATSMTLAANTRRRTISTALSFTRNNAVHFHSPSRSRFLYNSQKSVIATTTPTIANNCTNSHFQTSLQTSQQQQQQQQQRNFISLASSSIYAHDVAITERLKQQYENHHHSFPYYSSSSSSSSRLVNNNLYLQHQQYRYRRHDRSSAFSKPRPKTKKQRQEYNRRMKKIQQEQEKHNPPGSRAGPLRQFQQERWQQLLDYQPKTKTTKTIGAGGSASALQQQRLPATLQESNQQEEEEYGLNDYMLEELIGNTSFLTSQPTPEPAYLGHLHDTLFQKVSKQMDWYRQGIHAAEQQQQQKGETASSSSSSFNELLDISISSLPSDKLIGDVIRAYRDKHGTRLKPIGIVMALQHVLKDLGIPTVAFGECTFTSLLTCCRTPNEARRIFKLMNQHRHPISAYSWSILADIYAKLGDFEGCANVIKEMASEGVAPTLPAYTSLLAACYKVCNDGRIAHSIRARAGKVGWEHWQELRIVGIEPDVMAYGAIIRLCAARGQPERAINLLEEMHRFNVKPTTLCFSGALKAVARSHETAIRFERGSSRKQLRRETIAAHHGRMARQIVIMADNAEVEQDDGFVSALMLCAAAAGDSATAKAVFLAAEVRRMEHLRTIPPGSPMQHLHDGRRRSATNKSTSVLGEMDESPSITSGDVTKENSLEINDWNSNEQPDLSTLSSSSSNIQEGRHDKEYNRNYPKPQIKSYGEREYGKDTRTVSALLRACAQAMDSNCIGTIWAGTQNEGYLCENSQRLITTRWEPSLVKSSVPGVSDTKVGIGALKRYDEFEDAEDRNSKKGAARKKFRGLYIDEDPMTQEEIFGSVEDDDDDKNDGEDLKLSSLGAKKGAFEVLEDDDDDDVDEDDYEEFTDFEDDPAELEAFLKQLEEDDDTDYESVEGDDLPKTIAGSTKTIEVNEMLNGQANLIGVSAKDSPEYLGTLNGFDSGYLPQDDSKEDDNNLHSRDGAASSSSSIVTLDGNSTAALATADQTDASEYDKLRARYDDRELEIIEELKSALPGLPTRRITKIMKVFTSTLGAPSMLSLVPLLRETMPDYVTLPWLKRMNRKNAEFVLAKATENGNINRPLLDTMLQVKASSGALDSALQFYDEAYKKHSMKPNQYSDRLLVEMLVENDRVPRALTLKQQIESSGRTLDLPSYGHLIEYYSKKEQMGSALMLLKECVAVHGAPPSEKYLVKLRLGCRQMKIESEARLEDLIGEDPIQWLRHGETFLKREKSKKGRRHVQLVGNTLL